MIGRVLLFAALLLAAFTPADARDAGRLVEYERIAVAGLPDQRLTIWLPPGYDRGKRRYPVLYMHDGHNLFDPAKSNFNKVWAADKAMLAVIRTGRVEPHIIVGIWSPGPDRWRQYLPADIHAAASPALRSRMDAIGGDRPVVSQRYVDWIADDLKRWVDAGFRTRSGRDDTAIAGSSMGGLVSCYAFLRHPKVFGRAACISSHWPASDPSKTTGADAELAGLWDRWFERGLGSADGRRLWLDHGTATLDQYYAPYQQVVDRRIAAQGWRRGIDWESRVYPGAEHEENAWAARLPEVFGWLLRRSR